MTTTDITPQLAILVDTNITHVPKAESPTLYALGARIRNLIRVRTLPWAHGLRLMPAEHWADLVERMASEIEDYNRLAAASHPGAEVRITPMPVPTPDKFSTLTLPDDAVADLQAAYQAAYDHCRAVAIEELRSRVRAALHSLANHLAPDRTRRLIRDTSHMTARQQLLHLRTYNVVGDETTLAVIADAVDMLGILDPVRLRKDNAYRQVIFEALMTHIEEVRYGRDITPA